MSSKYSPEVADLDDKLERMIQLQKAIEQASQQVHIANSLQPQEQQVMLRIMAQRRRIRQRDAQPKSSRGKQRSARAATTGFTAQAWDAAGEPNAYPGDAAGLIESVPFVADAKAFALRHPIAVGLALGSGLIIGPRRVFRAALWAAPFLWRSWSVAQRVNLNLRNRV